MLNDVFNNCNARCNMLKYSYNFILERFMEDVKTLIEKLTLEEKVSLLSGKTFWITYPVERLGIPSVKMTDGPHGTREEIEGGGVTNVMKDSVPSTCFPSLVVYGSSWDRGLAYECAKSIGEEAAAQGISTVLGPGTNIKRSPLCGRNFEYFSEDPYLSGELASAFIDGLQSENVGASLKHYCANNQENSRMSIDTIVDERALREIYLPAFETAVKRSKPWQVMCSYNRLNGEFLSENKHMINDVLRGEFGFDGMVVSDWGAINRRVPGVDAGVDLEMPGNNGLNNQKIIDAVKDGTLSEEALDKAVENVLRYVEKGEKSLRKGYTCDYDKHHETARRMAAAGAVLLKNDDSTLPYDKKDKIAVIGALADKPRYQGGGSSQIHPKKLVSILDALRAENVDFDYAEGYSLKGDGYDAKLLKNAVEVAKSHDKVIVVIGLTPEYESEGFDRSHMDLPMGHNKLVDELAKVNENLVVVLVCGSPVTLPWTKRVKALLNIYVGGEAGGEAAVDILFGKVNPSGKLAETFPKRLSDNINSAYFPMGTKNVQYRESVFVGYRYFDTAGKPVRYPFGFGLSYTTFAYSDIKVSADKLTDNDVLSVSFDIENTGSVAGAEVAQVYVKDVKSTIFRPEKELKGFEKVFLNPGEKKTVTVTLDKRAFAFYNVCVNDWTVESGEFEILVGASSRDIKLSHTVAVTAPEVGIKDYRQDAPAYYDLANATELPIEQFSAIYGKDVPENVAPKRGEFDVNSTVNEVAVTRLGKFLRSVLVFGAKLLTRGAANKTMAVNGIVTMPLRSFSSFTGGLVSETSVDGLVDMLNKTKGGFKKFVKGFKKSQKPQR